MSKADIERLRRAILGDRNRAGRERKPFDRTLRNQVLAHVEARRKTGERIDHIAESLGINADTLRYWVAKSLRKSVKKQGYLRRIRVVDDQRVTPAGRLTLCGPGGTRLEGLTSDQVLDLWRRLS